MHHSKRADVFLALDWFFTFYRQARQSKCERVEISLMILFDPNHLRDTRTLLLIVVVVKRTGLLLLSRNELMLLSREDLIDVVVQKRTGCLL